MKQPTAFARKLLEHFPAAFGGLDFGHGAVTILTVGDNRDLKAWVAASGWLNNPPTTVSYRSVDVPLRELLSVARAIFDLRAQFADGEAICGTTIDERRNRIVVITKHATPKLKDQLIAYVGPRIRVDHRVASRTRMH